MSSRTNSPPATYDDIHVDTTRDTEESNTIPGIPLFTDTEKSNTITGIPLFTDTEESNTIPRTDDGSPINIVLVGKTGADKSYTGNYLLGKPVFLSMPSTNSITSKCYTETKELDNGITIKVIDTPGLFDTRQTIAETLKDLYSLFCLTETGPHVFLYVIRIDDRITDECKSSFNLFREILGQNIKKHLILVLHRKPNDRESTLMIQESKYLTDIITECRGRYVCLDYVETPSYGNCDGHLLKLILDTVRDNERSHYTREMYNRAIEPYNAKLKLEEDNRKLSRQVQELTGLLAKQELKNKRTGCVERGLIPTAQYKKIQTNYETLLKHIVNPIAVCRKLFSALVFDENDKEIIESEKLRSEQTDKLLMTLTRRGPRAFDELLLALSATGHRQAKEILEQDEGEDVAATNDNRYFIMKIKFPDLQYHSEYSDPNSEKYKELNDKLETLFKEYGCDATVTSLSPGSVIVSLVFATSTSTDEDSLLAILHKVLTSGYLGEYKVSTDDFLFRRIGEWLTNSNTNNTEEVIPVIGDKNTVSLTEQHGDGVIVDCVLSTSSKSELNNFYPILEIILKSGRFDQNQVSADQFSFHQIGGWLNEKPETTTDKQGAVMIDEQATLSGKMKTDKPESSSSTDTSSASGVSPIRYKESSVPCTESTEQAMYGSMQVLGDKDYYVDFRAIEVNNDYVDFRAIEVNRGLNVNQETTTDQQRSIRICEQATLPRKMKNDKPESSSRTDTSSASDVSPIRYKESSVPCTDITEQATSRTGRTEVLDNKGCVNRGGMSVVEYRKIQGNYHTLLKHIENPTDVCRELCSAFIFDENDKEIIESEKVRREQTHKLLMILTHRGPRAFRKFLLALSATGHHQAKEILEDDDYVDFEAIKDNRWLNEKEETTTDKQMK